MKAFTPTIGALLFDIDDEPASQEKLGKLELPIGNEAI